MKKIGSIIFLIFISFSINAEWNGYDWDSGNYVDIESGNLVREGQNIEIYDWGTGSYSDVEVTDIDSFGSGTEVEVYDYSSGEYRILDMD